MSSGASPAASNTKAEPQDIASALVPDQCSTLSSLEGIEHGFFSRVGGVSTGLYAGLNCGLGSSDNREHVLENRNRVAGHFGVQAKHLLTVYQVHSPTCMTVSGPWADNTPPQADALATATPGVALGIMTADCGPVLFADPVARVIGAAHAGWKGAHGGVLEQTVQAMEALGATRDNIMTTLGPTISQTAYEVGPEFYERLATENPANAQLFKPSSKPDHHMFDLPRYIARRLADTGIRQHNDLALCTYADEQRYFSYRRTTHRKEPDYGRLISVITLSPDQG